MTPTKQEIQGALQITVAVTEAIREAGEIPEGTLYGMLCGKMELSAFEKMRDLIVRTGLVERHGNLLRWIGPRV